MAASKKVVTIKSPLGGVYRRADFQTEKPFTCLDARDIWPLDASTGRRRLAVRPGFAAFGSQAACNLITSLEVAPSETNQRQLMIARGGTLYRHTSGTSFTAVSGSAVSTSRNVQAASYGSKLYVANDTNPGVYTYSGHGWANWSSEVTAGTVPTSCRLICEWDTRAVLAGDPANPNVINFSRMDDWNDWDYAELDRGAAQAFSINEPTTCLIPHNRQCLIVGTAHSMWIFRGNPMQGGTLEKMAHVVGPINQTAWCKTADDWTYMLTRDGLYRMPPGCGAPPESVSRERIPESLLGLDGVAYKGYLAYDVRFRGIHIYVEGATPQRFWFDVEDGGFWPVTSPGSSILSIYRYGPIETANVSGVLIGTSSNLVRLDRTATLGGSDKAYVVIGPIRVSTSPLWKNRMDEAVTILGDVTDDTTGTLDFHLAGSAEAAGNLPTDRSYSTTIGALINSPRCYPMQAGHALVLKYSQGLTSKVWAFEELSAVLTSCGREVNY